MPEFNLPLSWRSRILAGLAVLILACPVKNLSAQTAPGQWKSLDETLFLDASPDPVTMPGPLVLPPELSSGQREELQQKLSQAKPGDEIAVPEGSLSGFSFLLSASGTKDRPITVKAKTPGKTFLAGDTDITISGDFVVFRDFVVTGTTTKQRTLWVTPDSEGAKILHNDFNLRNYAGTSKHHAVYMEGVDVELAYNSFRNISSPGEWVRIYRNNTKREDRDHIHHNFFYNRDFGGSNGGEMLQIGLKETQDGKSGSIVEYNWFEECNGEAEIVSVKASGNILRYNTFKNNNGTLTLRHGNANLVEGNAFFFTKKMPSGGLRVYGSDHVIVNNYFENLPDTYDDQRGPISLHSGKTLDYPDQGSTRPADNVLVAFNTLANCSQGIIFGRKSVSAYPFPPQRITLAWNILIPKPGAKAITRYTKPDQEKNWAILSNLVYGVLGIEQSPGFEQKSSPDLAKVEGLYVPQAKGTFSSVLDAVFAGHRYQKTSAKLSAKPGEVGPAWVNRLFPD